MSIAPAETEIIGSWVVVNGRLTEDETCRRLRSLVENHLQHVATSADGWEKLYQDPNDGRYWEWLYPQAEMQRGGPPALRVLSPETARRRYGVR